MFVWMHQNRQYDVTCRVGIGRNFICVRGTSTNLEGVRRFGCACEFGELVIWQVTTAAVI